MGVIRDREVKRLLEVHTSGPLKWGKKLPLLFTSAPEVTLEIMNWVENDLICRTKLSNHPFSCASITRLLFT